MSLSLASVVRSIFQRCACTTKPRWEGDRVTTATMMPNQRVANATNQSVSPFRFMKDVLSTVAIRDRGGTHPATLSGSHRLTSGTIAHRIHAPTNVDATDAG